LRSSFSSFVESRGQILIDLSLYVSSQNYYGNTSPAYGNLLQWPNQWILPPKLHGAAKARTEHLGMSSLDLQAMEEQRQREHSAAVAAGRVPKNLIARPRDTVSKLLGRTAQQSHFRLEGLTGEFFEPLEAMLGQKAYLLAAKEEDTPSSLDCIVLGYLSLALVPELTFPWLRDAMRTKSPRLAAYTERVRRRCFGQTPVEVAHAFTPESAPSSPLPWRTPSRISVAAVGSTLLDSLAESTPLLSRLRRYNGLKAGAQSPDADLSGLERNVVSQAADAGKNDLYASVAAVVGGVALLVGYMFHIGMISTVVTGQEEDEEEQEKEEDEEGGMVDAGTAADFLNMGGLGDIGIPGSS
jgi:sorting and assembly machinery component 37